jgi:hypothetical protein
MIIHSSGNVNSFGAVLNDFTKISSILTKNSQIYGTLFKVDFRGRVSVLPRTVPENKKENHSLCMI